MTDGLYDKYQLIDSIIVQVDALADMRGAEKCRTIIDIIQKLAAMKKGLKDDETIQQQKIDMLEDQIRQLTNSGDGADEKTYRIGIDPREQIEKMNGGDQ